MSFFKSFSKKSTTKKATTGGASSRPWRGRSYGMGNIDRLSQDFFSGSMSADQAVFGALEVARNRARWLSRNHDLTRKFLIMAKTHVIGAKGIRLQSRASDIVKGHLVDSEMDQEVIEAAYSEFSKARNFSIDTRLDRRLFSQVAFQAVLVDGECIIRKIRGADNKFGLSFQLIDAELLDHNVNRPKNGTKRDPDGR